MSLGDPSKTCGFLAKPREVNNNTTTAGDGAGSSNNLGFCMALGINSNPTTQNPEKSTQDDDIDDDEDTSDDEQQRVSPVQLDLLPLVPVRSDNGSSEGGSSGNALAVRGFDVNRMPALPGMEEATSSFRMDFGMYRTGNVVGSKRNIEAAAGNDVVEAERASSRASDEDENGLSRKKLRLSKDQSAYLEESFKEHNTLNPKQKLALAKQLNLRPRQVEVWFQNRRARTKLKQTEVDCEYLKRCCETLTEENRRLHKELQELRALKSTSNPFYMQLPATTLTMCPSCERVATTTTTTNSSAAVAPPAATTTTDPTSKPPSTTNPFPLSSSKPRFYPFSNTPSPPPPPPPPTTTQPHPPTPS